MNVAFLDRHQVASDFFKINLSFSLGPQLVGAIALELALLNQLVQKEWATIFPDGTITAE